MSYPELPDFRRLTDAVMLYSQLKHEHGARGIDTVLRAAQQSLEEAVRALQSLGDDPEIAAREPEDLAAIRSLRPPGPRRIWRDLDERRFVGRLEGALLGRCAGCTLGAPVEFWSIDQMEAWAREIGQPFPPVDYWNEIPGRHELRYSTSRKDSYTARGIDGVPVDDDIAYTLLGLLIAEDHGPDFSTAQVGEAWLRYLPFACTAEDVALRNLKKGVSADRAAEIDNPFSEWIGADIRSDPWGYVAPGWPEKAAAMAYADARLTHRRNGVYGAMLFSAAISAGFTTGDPVEALRIGLTEIPAECATARAVRWALEEAPGIRNHREARAAVDERWKGMHGVHTINNACLTVWGLTIGGTDFTRVISETVAMGLDNDCTAATAGSIVGAVVGKAGVPRHWYEPFGDTVHSYLNGPRSFGIDDLVSRFTAQARRTHQTGTA